MFLNETKPPLEEAMAHMGVKGMKWGQRRAERRLGRAQAKANDQVHKDLEREFDDDRHASGKRKVAIGVLAVAGTAATVAILHKSGHLKIPSTLRSNSQAERARARALYENSSFAKRSFRPENVGNPLFTRTPKSPKAARDFVDAGFGKNGVFNVTTMTRGAKTVKDFNADVWDSPVRAITK